MSTDRQMDKEDVTYTVEYHSARKSEEIMPCAATWMELELS